MREHKILGVLADVVAEDVHGSGQPLLGIVLPDARHDGHEQGRRKVDSLAVELELGGPRQAGFGVDQVQLGDISQEVGANRPTHAAGRHLRMDVGRGTAGFRSRQAITEVVPTAEGCIRHLVITLGHLHPLIAVLAEVRGDQVAPLHLQPAPVSGQGRNESEGELVVLGFHAGTEPVEVGFPLVVNEAVCRGLLQWAGVRCPLGRVARSTHPGIGVDLQLTDTPVRESSKQRGPDSRTSGRELVGEEDRPRSAQSICPVRGNLTEELLGIHNVRDAAHILGCHRAAQQKQAFASGHLGHAENALRLRDTRRALGHRITSGHHRQPIGCVRVSLGPISCGRDLVFKRGK